MKVREAREILDAVRRTEKEKYWLKFRELALSSYWLYLRLVLDYRFLDPWDHGEELVNFLETNLNKPMLLLVPRGGCKTASVTIPLLPWLIARNPATTGIITNCRDEKATYFARQAADIILNCENYRKCFPYVQPAEKWGEGGYFIKPPRSKGGDSFVGGAMGRADPNINAVGVGGNITGSHVKALLHDDLINEETAQFPNQRQRAEKFFTESLSCLDPGGVLTVCATRWHFDDLYGKMEAGTLMGGASKFAVFKRGAERYSLDDNGETCVEIYNPHRTYVDVRGFRCEIGYTKAELESQKMNRGPLYHALYMNNPISDSDRLLNVENIRTFITFNDSFQPLRRMGVEVNSQGASFYDALIRGMQEQKRMFSLDRITPRSVKGVLEKHARIRAVVGPLTEAGRLWIREDLFTRDGNLGQEIREFDKGTDDCLDALTYCIVRAPKWVAGRPPEPYLAVDPAFTANAQSDYTAIVVGMWMNEDFYVLDCHKFKAQKADIIINQIFRMADKYKEGVVATKTPTKVRPFYSPGNGPRGRRMPAIRWGDGHYTDNLKEKDNA